MEKHTKYDIVISMLRREAENVLMSPSVRQLLSRFGIGNSAVILLGLNAAEKFVKQSPRVKMFIEDLVAKDEDSIDATAEVIKEEFESKLSSFGDRLKQKLKEKEGV